MPKKFIKNKEDFICENCGFEVVGNGYTNHCPKCLYSKHVDINPGDRASECGGLMTPVSVEGTQKEYVLTHKCMVCGYTKNNKVATGDSVEMLAKIALDKGL